MPAVGGSYESVTIAGRTFAVASDADVSRRLGGFKNEHKDNGDGSGRLIKTREGWRVEGLNLSIDDNAGDQEALQDIRDLKDYQVVTLTEASGDVYQGVGQIVDDSDRSSNEATASVTLQGPGKLTKQ